MEPEAMKAAARVPSPMIINVPATSSIVAAQPPGQSVHDDVFPPHGATGHPVSVDRPWQRNRKPTTMRNAAMPHGAAALEMFFTGGALHTRVWFAYPKNWTGVRGPSVWVYIPNVRQGN